MCCLPIPACSLQLAARPHDPLHTPDLVTPLPDTVAILLAHPRCRPSPFPCRAQHSPTPLWMNPVANRTLPPEQIRKPDANHVSQYKGPYPIFAFCKSDYHAGGLTRITCADHISQI